MSIKKFVQESVNEILKDHKKYSFICGNSDIFISMIQTPEMKKFFESRHKSKKIAFVSHAGLHDIFLIYPQTSVKVFIDHGVLELYGTLYYCDCVDMPRQKYDKTLKALLG